MNSTLGFQRVYVVHSASDPSSLENFKAIALLLDIDAQYIEQTSIEHADTLQRQHQYLANPLEITELDTHARIYAHMAHHDIQSALIIRSDVDMELDIKLRLASALGDIPDPYDMLFIGREYAEPTEPKVQEMMAFLRQTNGTSDPSAQMQRMWAKREFANRKTRVYRSSFPSGISAYAIGRQMARRLHYRLRPRMTVDKHDLDFILADVAMVGLSIAYSMSPSPVAAYKTSRGPDNQLLTHSALHLMSLRQDDPAMLSPYKDWTNTWT
ncbi:hypothetical protein GGH12_003105 [Coemansia sp. RSA 1822]|nr:hypothetical protein LPJ76_002999 [Coemansia sp. RSA 638]KAJ2126030.1 hypothetical protein IW147_000502 [Coemansia sp. RSA 720]KAJ2545805.1 hypothetical protein GGF49_000008 [Coemansia sp. RSA 1853]KAJ2562579.1 hypothetical protein GGH12_003105 [Coemansia sp. RSA 1822]